MTDLTGAVWRKSTRSGDNGGNCVEVSTNLNGLIAVRDSKEAGGPALVFAATAWQAFLSTLQRQRSGTHSHTGPAETSRPENTSR